MKTRFLGVNESLIKELKSKIVIGAEKERDWFINKNVRNYETDITSICRLKIDLRSN